MVRVEVTPGCVRQLDVAQKDGWQQRLGNPIDRALDVAGVKYRREGLVWKFSRISYQKAEQIHNMLTTAPMDEVVVVPLDESLWKGKYKPKAVGDDPDVDEGAPEPPDGPCLVQALLYELMRDHVPPGVIEGIVSRQEEYSGEAFMYSNKHLARYAMELAERLKG